MGLSKLCRLFSILSFRCLVVLVVVVVSTLVVEQLHLVTAAAANEYENTQTTTTTIQKKLVGTLLASELSNEPTIYSNWHTTTTTTTTTTDNTTGDNKNSLQSILFNRTSKLPIHNSLDVVHHENQDNNYNNEIIKIHYQSGSVKQTAYSSKDNNSVTTTKNGGGTTSSTSNDDDDDDDTKKKKIAEAEVKASGLDVTFSILRSLMTHTEVQTILQLLNQYDKDFFDDDPDTVDGMPSYEIFVSTPEIVEQEKRNMKGQQQLHEKSKEELNPEEMLGKYRDLTEYNKRTELRTKLQKILQPIINERITPYIKWKYPQFCDPDYSTTNNHDNEGQSDDVKTNHGRLCVACYSLIRRYKYGERKSHAIHNDGHAVVTAVTSLSDYETHYRGGLYVVSPNSMIRDNYSYDYNNDDKKENDNKNKTTNSYYDYHTIYNNTIRNNFQFLGLNSGDTVVHTSNLLHGVKVYDKKKQPKTTERWSWILWYKDVTPKPLIDHQTTTKNNNKTMDMMKQQEKQCDDDADTYSYDCYEDHSHERFKQCAYDGDMVCQELYSVKGKVNVSESVSWAMLAANQGASTSAIKIARAYVHKLNVMTEINGKPIVLIPYNVSMAYRYYNIAIQSNNNPEGHYGIAELILEKLQKRQEQTVVRTKKQKKNNDENNMNPFVLTPYVKKQLQRVIYHLEQAAMAGHVFSMFNLGIAHTYGYGIYHPPSSSSSSKSKTTGRSLSSDNMNTQMSGIINPIIARDWYVKSGLPEGYYVASFQAASQGDQMNQKIYMDQATILGYHQPWRKIARQNTGSGTVASISINLPWPMAEDGRVPPQF